MRKVGRWMFMASIATMAGHACAPFWLMDSSSEGVGEASDSAQETADPRLEFSAHEPGCRDRDGDGFTSVLCGGADCDDSNGDRYPEAPEICENEILEGCGSEVEALLQCPPTQDLSNSSRLDLALTSDDRFRAPLAMVADVNQNWVDFALIGGPAEGSTGFAGLVLGADWATGVDAEAVELEWISITGSTNCEAFGASVSGGDLDGDGYQDVLIGAPFQDETSGGWSCNWGGGGVAAGMTDARPLEEPLPESSPRVALMGAAYARGSAWLFSGEWLSGHVGEDLDASDAGTWIGSGEADGDGYGDAVAIWTGSGDASSPGILVVGAPTSGDGDGSIYLTDGEASTATMLGEPGDGAGNALACSDLNGDGVAELAVGASRAGDDAGIVYLLEGGDIPVDGYLEDKQSAILDWGATGALFGYAIAGGGDLNWIAGADGYQDLIIGSPGYSTSELPNAGAISYVLGGADWDAIRAQPAFGGDVENARCGEAVALGDINADGVAEMIIGCPGADTATGAETEGVDVYYAEAVEGGLGRDLEFHGPVNFGHDDTVSDTYTGIGSSLAAGGDLTGDGYGDLLIGVQSHGGDSEVHLIRGSTY